MSKAKTLFFCLFYILLLFCFSSQVQAQVPDPTHPALEEEEPGDLHPVPITEIDSLGTLPVEVADTTLVPVPGTAAFYSAVLPGLGQAYNNAHWKIPLIYIGGAFIVYIVNDYNKGYSTSVRNLNLIILDPTINEVSGMGKDIWERRSNGYRRQRDYFIILGGVLYMLNIVEAYVDAHLQDFNVNDDLSIRLKPSLMPTGAGSMPGAGLALTFTLK